MAYIRSKKIKGNTYYYVVEGKLNKKGLVKQKVILYLGNVQRIIEVFNYYTQHNKDLLILSHSSRTASITAFY